MRKRLLVVDDSMFIREKLKDILKDCGCDIVGEAHNGVVAIEEYVKLKPCAVCMDVNMPELDGIKALKKILELDPKAKVIMLSVLSRQDIPDTALSAGAYAYIHKPINEEQFRKVVSNL